MYDTTHDTYCYEGSSVLKNIPGLRNQSALDEFEVIATTQRSDEPLPEGVLDAVHYRSLHHHLFQDVYLWAGTYRATRTHKGGSSFCYPEHIESQMNELFATLENRNFLFGLSRDQFVKEIARFLGMLNAIHPFREGNGRTQMAFVTLLADRAGHPLDLEKLEPKAFLAAMIASFNGDLAPLEKQLMVLTG